LKGLSILVTLQGLSYCIQSILGFYIGTELKFGVQLINSNYNLVGIVLGVLLIITGIGIWYRKEYAYNSAMVVYSLLVIYGMISICYLLITQTIESGILVPIVLITIISILFLLFIRYVKTNKFEFK
jgi:hypothetical protein